MAARRTEAAGMPTALATASAITPTSAPWRSSPPRRRRRNVCSASVALANNPVTSSARRACDPFPATVPISVNLASTCSTSSDGSAAGGGSERSETPADADLPLRQLADSHDTTTAASVGSPSAPAWRSRSAILAIFPSRCGAHVGGCGGDLNELHEVSLARGSDISQQVGEHT